MRIIVDARYLSGRHGGPATYSECLLEQLARIDADNEYVCLVQPAYAPSLRSSPFAQMVCTRSPACIALSAAFAPICFTRTYL